MPILHACDIGALLRTCHAVWDRAARWWATFVRQRHGKPGLVGADIYDLSVRIDGLPNRFSRDLTTIRAWFSEVASGARALAHLCMDDIMAEDDGACITATVIWLERSRTCPRYLTRAAQINMPNLAGLLTICASETRPWHMMRNGEPLTQAASNWVGTTCWPKRSIKWDVYPSRYEPVVAYLRYSTCDRNHQSERARAANTLLGHFLLPVLVDVDCQETTNAWALVFADNGGVVAAKPLYNGVALRWIGQRGDECTLLVGPGVAWTNAFTQDGPLPSEPAGSWRCSVCVLCTRGAIRRWPLGSVDVEPLPHCRHYV